jgi:hypothetical protein
VYTVAPDVADEATLFEEYKIITITGLWEPIAARSAAFAPLYSAYLPSQGGSFSPSVANLQKVPNHVQWDSSKPARFAYRPQMPASATSAGVSFGEFLNKGWLDTALLTNAGVALGPGILALYGDSFPASTKMGRFTVVFDIKIRGAK